MIRAGRRSLASSLLLAFAAVHCAIAPAESPPPRPFFDEERAAVIAHRGGLRVGPEHTLWTFERALAFGVDAIEVDVRATRDGALVLLHDETVDRTTDGRGAVADVALAEIRGLDAAHRWSPDGGRTFPFRGEGLRIPTVEEVFARFPRTPFVIEIKSAERGAAEALCRAIRGFDRAERVLVGAFRSEAIGPFRRACPDVATAATAREVGRFWLLRRLFLPVRYRPPADAFLVPEWYYGLRVVDAGFVSRAGVAGMPVGVWTVDEPADVERLVDLGVRAFVTDDPERVLAALGRRAGERRAGRRW